MELETRLFINNSEVEEITFGNTYSSLTLDLRVFRKKDDHEVMYLTDNKGNAIAKFLVLDNCDLQVLKLK